MDVRSGGAAADADIADDVPALDAHTRSDRKAREMAVPGFDAKTVIHDDEAAVSRMQAGVGDHAVGGRPHAVAVLRADIHAGVEGALTTERVHSLAEITGDSSDHRPHIGRDGNLTQAGSGKGKQAHLARIERQFRRVAFEKPELFQALIVGSIRSCERLAQGEWSITEANKSVGHGHFGGQRLQRGEPLIGLVRGLLQVVILPLESTLLLEQRVVVAGLPEQARVRTQRGGHCDSADHGQTRQGIQGVERHPDAAHRAASVGSNEQSVGFW